MKMKMKALFAAVALTVLAGQASAQTWTCNDEGSNKICRAVITSASTVTALPLKTDAAGIRVYVSGTVTTISYANVLVDRFNVPLDTGATSATTTTTSAVQTISTPFYASRLRVSPTAGLTGTNAVNVLVSQPEK